MTTETSHSRVRSLVVAAACALGSGACQPTATTGGEAAARVDVPLPPTSSARPPVDVEAKSGHAIGTAVTAVSDDFLITFSIDGPRPARGQNVEMGDNVNNGWLSRGDGTVEGSAEGRVTLRLGTMGMMNLRDRKPGFKRILRWGGDSAAGVPSVDHDRDPDAPTEPWGSEKKKP